MPNFIALGIYFILGTKSSWNEGIHTYFNVEYVLLVRNSDFLGGSLVVTAHYLVVTCGYYLLLGVTGRCPSLLLIPTFSMKAFGLHLNEKQNLIYACCSLANAKTNLKLLKQQQNTKHSV